MRLPLPALALALACRPIIIVVEDSKDPSVITDTETADNTDDTEPAEGTVDTDDTSPPVDTDDTSPPVDTDDTTIPVDTDDTDVPVIPPTSGPWCGSGCTWSTTDVATIGGTLSGLNSLTRLDAVIDGQDRLHIATLDTKNLEVRHHLRSGATWSSTLAAAVDPAARNLLTQTDVDIAVQPNGTVLVAFTDDKWRLAHDAGSGWSQSSHATISALARFDSATELAADGTGQLHYFRGTGYKTGDWQAWTAQANAGGKIRDLAMRGNVPAAVWVDFGGTPRLGEFRNGWTNQAVSNRQTSRIQVGANAAEVHMAITFDATGFQGSYRIVHIAPFGSSWLSTTVTDDCENLCEGMDLAVDASGDVHLAWEDDNDVVRYGLFHNGSWTTQAVAPMGIDQLVMLVRDNGAPVIVVNDVGAGGNNRDIIRVLSPTPTP